MKDYWIGVIIVVAISLGVTFFAPINEFFKSLSAVPAIGALLFPVFQLYRDSTAQARATQLQNEQQLFNLGATSHMANVVFDKHVEFCEKYLSEVHETTLTLFQKGPVKEALDHASNLYSLHIEYTAWITPDMTRKLEPFEKAIRQIGADAGLVSALDNADDKEEARSKAIDRMYATLVKTLNLEKLDIEHSDSNSSAIAVQSAVRDILRIDQLVSIREQLIEKASSIQAIKKT